MNVEEFSNKYSLHETNRKKLLALHNFSSTLTSFKDWLAVEFIARSLDEGFLDDEGEHYLNHILKKYGIDYTQWIYKTPWLKRHICSKKAMRAAFFFQSVFEDPHHTPKKKKISIEKNQKVIQLDIFSKEKGISLSS